MANSMISTNYITKFVSSCSEADNYSFQQSDWSLYVDDFKTTNYDMEDSSFFSGFQSSSVISDGGWSDFGETKDTFVDEELEDTACSPVNSPKVNDLDYFFMNSKGMDIAKENVSQEKRHISQLTESIDKGLIETELRRKGLCLVPVSMAVNYLG